METLFIGVFLVLLDISVNIGGYPVGILPDFLGYMMIGRGLSELAGLQSPHFDRLRGKARVFTVYSLVLYVLSIFRVTEKLGGLGLVISLVTFVFAVYTVLEIIKGIRDAELALESDFQVKTLTKAFCVWTVVGLAAVILCETRFASQGVILNLAISALYLYVFNKSVNLYMAKTK
mgnify:CR=1 FL=1|jgi:hypothetical protein